jgi:hypothetical protein
MRCWRAMISALAMLSPLALLSLLHVTFAESCARLSIVADITDMLSVMFAMMLSFALLSCA